MKLIALLILLVLRRIEFRRGSGPWRDALYGVLLAPAGFIGGLARTAAAQLVLLVLFWACVGFLIRFGLVDVLLSLPLLVLYLALLWALVGRDALGPDLNEYLRLWYLKDHAELRAFAQARFGAVADTDGALHRAVLRAVFVRAFRETFSRVIVFAVTGLPGLLALATLEAAQGGTPGRRDEFLAQVATEARARLDWLAARLLGATLLLTGNSSRAWPILDSRLLDDEDPAEELVADICVAASGVPPHALDEPDVGLDVTDARGLLLRTQVVWIMLMAVSVIVGF